MESGEPIWRRPPLVSAVHELRWFGRTWLVVAAVGIAADLVSGAVFEFSARDVWASTLLFGLTVLATLARLFLGLRLARDTKLYFDPEIAGGRGFSGVTGIANFPNGELPRVASATPKPYIHAPLHRVRMATCGSPEITQSSG